MPDRASVRRVVSASGAFAPGHLGELTQTVPFEMVDEVLEGCDGRVQRVRLLPSRVVVYLLLGRGGVRWSGVGPGVGEADGLVA